MTLFILLIISLFVSSFMLGYALGELKTLKWADIHFTRCHDVMHEAIALATTTSTAGTI